MKKIWICIGLLVAAVAAAGAQVTVSGDITTISVISFAEDSQMITNAPGGYTTTKNGYYTNAGLVFSFNPVSYVEGYARINAVYRPGSFYVPLSLESTGEKTFVFEVDSVYGKFHLFDALSLSDIIPVDVSFKTGKYKSEAASFQKVSKYATEAVTSMLKTGTTYNYDLEVVYPFESLGLDGSVSATVTGNYLFGEAVQRRYDNDGSVSFHGEPVLNEYDAQVLAALRLNDFDLFGSPLSAEFVYVRNGADFYTGNSIGFSAGYAVPIIEETLTLPVGLGFAYYEKNLDAMAAVADKNVSQDTTALRATTRIGLGVGARYTAAPLPLAAELNLASAISVIDHLYRNPLSLVSLSVDLKATYLDTYFLGVGFIAGTLADAEWKTNDGANEAYYEHTFTPAENLGYEVYAGVNFYKNSRFILGVNTNRGIAINRTLENRADSQIKYKQKDTAESDGKYETGGLYVKFVFAW